MSEQITAEQAERLNEKWESWAVEDHRLCCGEASWRAVIEPHWSCWCDTRSSALEAAYAYTKAHERKIAEKREEIVLVGEMATIPQGMMELYAKKGLEFSLEFVANREIAQRILAILEAQLAELLKGWRQS